MSALVRAFIEGAAFNLATPDRLCVGALARDHRGNPCKPRSARAVSWCALGAVYRAAGEDPESNKLPLSVNAALCTVQACSAQLYRSSAEVVNDTVGHDAVLEVLRLAWIQAGLINIE